MTGSDDPLIDNAVAEVHQLRQRLSLLERMATDPSATIDSLRRRDLTAAAEKAGFRNAALAARLLSSDDGDPDELVAALAKTEPYMTAGGLTGDMNQALRSRGGRRDSTPDRQPETADMNKLIRSTAGPKGR